MDIRKLRKQVAKRYGKLCYICRERPGDTLDHLKPASLGGKSDIQNLRPCCGECNRKKSNMYPVTVRELRMMYRNEW